MFGDHVRKPMDEYVSRLVECWQMAQPLHLRHLSVLRDTVMKGKTTIYIYYTYGNFRKLVENGTGFWEAVKTVPDGVTKGNNVISSLDAVPELDEYGFPVLDPILFQGRNNDATLEECVSALNADRFLVPAGDPMLQEQADGTHGMNLELESRLHVLTANQESNIMRHRTLSQLDVRTIVQQNQVSRIPDLYQRSHQLINHNDCPHPPSRFQRVPRA